MSADINIPDSIMGLDQASAELDRMFAAEAANDTGEGGAAGSQADDSATSGQDRAAQAGEAGAQDQTTVTTDTPAAAAATDPKKQATATPAKGLSETGQKTPSRYEKARERQLRSWEELNAGKEALKKEREEFDRQRQEEQAKRAEAEKDFSPEAYEDAAKKFEEAGKFDFAEQARAKAIELRKNPPDQARAKAEQARTAQTQAQSKEWALKAGIDFPDVAKANSPLQLRVAQLLQDEPDLKTHPKGIYMAARLASLEAASAGVPAKDQELAQLRAKVKDLEGLTAPDPGGGVTALPGAKAFDQMSENEQLAQLEQQARELGPMR